ncbi:hypothetical protein AB0N65_10680 [Paenarthrobacter sp. NPDC089322]|uniref:hypothetical protein n=1 Tax=Paenarthrobacter sp. NPDC089322 TaxID=3155065 RepID=UPI00343F473D
MNTVLGRSTPRASFFGTLRARFPHLGVDLLKIFVALVCGAGFASLFRWDSGTDATTVTAHGIFLHNTALALLALFLTQYGATVMMILNGFWLGMGLVGSAASAGIQQTMALTVVHVPLEIVAWALTIQGARVLWPALLGVVRKEYSWRRLVAMLRGVLAAPIVFYVLAALAEWAEHAQLER